MRKIILFSLGVLVATTTINAQELDKQNSHKFKTLKKDSYLGNVEYDKESKTTSLYYVEKNPLNTVFATYSFDENMKFIDEKIEKFSIIDDIKKGAAELAEMVKTYKWFNYKGEILVSEIVYVSQGWGGKLVVSKQRLSKTYNWKLGLYFPKWENLGKMKIEGLEGDRIFLYDRFNNAETGEVVLLVGLKPPKGSKAKFQHARKFQLMKITSDFKVEYGDIVEFEHNMAICFAKSLAPPSEEVNDISKGNIGLIFVPMKSVQGGKWASKDPSKHTLIMVNSAAKIDGRIDYVAPTSGWVIEDVVVANGGSDLYFYGPAKDGAYVNKLMPTNSPLSGKEEIKDIKYKNFQIMKVTDKKLAWINNTDLKEFGLKAVTPPSQKKSPEYKGKNFVKTLVYVTSSGELIVAGQKYTTKKVADPNSNVAGAMIKVIDAYKDLVMFHFDDKGALKAQYGIKRDKNNKYSKRTLTPQYVYENADGSQLYWVYGEIKGMRKGFAITGGALELMGVGTLQKRKLLTYPAVAKVNLTKGTMGDFVPLGADAEGKQLYYTNPEYPQLLTDDRSSLIFVGEDKKGSLVWLGRMNLE